MIVRFVTLFPQPDSPTIPSVLPVLDRERHTVDRADDPVVGMEVRTQIADVEQRLAAYPASDVDHGSVRHSSLILGSMNA